MNGPDDYFDEIDVEDDDEAFAEMACGQDGHGGCADIGTEFCDWSCPFSHELAHNRRAARKDETEAAAAIPRRSA